MRITSVLSALAIAGLLVLTGDYVTFAATGDSFVLGRLNATGTTTTILDSGPSAALNLVVQPNQPPLSVSSRIRVGNLNADLLDGREAASFADATPTVDLRFHHTAAVSSNGFTHDLTGMAQGQWGVSYSVALAGVTGTPAAPVHVTCEIVQTLAGRTTFLTAEQLATSASPLSPIAVSGYGVVDSGQGQPQLKCVFPGGPLTWSTLPESPIQITLTRLDNYSRSDTNAPGDLNRGH